jgi:uncharacterized protein YutE (UPF0331/DUF86 family)
MIDKVFIELKLSYIQAYSKELGDVLTYPDQEIKEDFMKLRSLERLLQLIVDEIVDINSHIIRHGHFQAPDDFQGSFMVLAEKKIFPEEFAKKLAPVIGLRNRLVHRYEKIDLDILLDATRKNGEDFREYMRYIFEFMKKLR